MSRADQLRAFVIESNAIEGITREPNATEITAHVAFIALQHVTVGDLESFVREVADAPLRDQPGMDVRVGAHLPQRGGPAIRSNLELLLDQLDVVGSGWLTPYEVHIQYETLHPFMDGNGRSGRILWAWQMKQIVMDPFALPFLHRFYYQILAARS